MKENKKTGECEGPIEPYTMGLGQGKNENLGTLT